MVYAIRDFIRNFVEIDTDEIIDTRLTLSEAEDDLNAKKETKQDYVAAKMTTMLVEKALRHMTRSVKSGNYEKNATRMDHYLPVRLRN